MTNLRAIFFDAGSTLYAAIQEAAAAGIAGVLVDLHSFANHGILRETRVPF